MSVLILPNQSLRFTATSLDADITVSFTAIYRNRITKAPTGKGISEVYQFFGSDTIFQNKTSDDVELVSMSVQYNDSLSASTVSILVGNTLLATYEIMANGDEITYTQSGFEYKKSGNDLNIQHIDDISRLGVSITAFGDTKTATNHTPIFQAALDAVTIPGGEHYGKRLILEPSADYFFASHVTISGDTLPEIDGNYSEIFSTNTTHPRISGVTTIDTTIPTATDAGPMRGCAFYITGIITQATFSNIRLTNFRMAICHLFAINTPIYNNVTFSECNAGVFYYQGCQNATYNGINTVGGQMGPLHISSATCFPTGSLYAGLDNVMTDGFSIDLTSGGSIKGGVVIANFDNWFRDSILRPTVGSTWLGQSNYLYPPAITELECKPSGWGVAYIPFRNLRTCFTAKFTSLDCRDKCATGIACINTDINDLSIHNFQGEAIMTSATEYFRFGKMISGVAQSYSFVTATAPMLKQFIYYTGAGTANGAASDRFLSGLGYVPYQVPATPQLTPGISKGIATAYQIRQVALQNLIQASDGRADGAMAVSLDTTYGFRSTNDVIASGWKMLFALPQLTGSPLEWKRALRVDSDGNDINGLFTVNAINGNTGVTDRGVYRVQTGVQYTLTNTNIINNGDLQIVYTGSTPRLATRFLQLTFGGITVTVDRIDNVAKIIYLLAPVSGLAAPFAAAGTITKPQILTTVVTPTNTWFTVSLGGFSFLSATDFGIRSNLAVTPNQTTAFDAASVAGTSRSLILELSYSTF